MNAVYAFFLHLLYSTYYPFYDVANESVTIADFIKRSHIDLKSGIPIINEIVYVYS